MAFHFSSGGLPSTTNTSLAPRRVKYSNRKKRFLKCGLLTFSFRPLAHFASHIQPLKSTHNVLLLSVERFSFLLTGSSMFQSWWTPITTVPQGEWTLSEKQSWCSKLRAFLGTSSSRQQGTWDRDFPRDVLVNYLEPRPHPADHACDKKRKCIQIRQIKTLTS